jgi:Holliday junction resolvase RusA-like endonuclease
MNEKHNVVQLIIPGKPVAKGRPFFSTKGGKFRAFTPKATASYENLVKTLAQKKFKKPLDGPLRLSMHFLMPRPKYMVWKTKPMPRQYCDKRPDLDNCIKSIKDGLNGIAFTDDAQIAELTAIKEYHAGGEGPQTIIEIERVPHGG